MKTDGIQLEQLRRQEGSAILVLVICDNEMGGIGGKLATTESFYHLGP